MSAREQFGFCSRKVIVENCKRSSLSNFRRRNFQSTLSQTSNACSWDSWSFWIIVVLLVFASFLGELANWATTSLYSFWNWLTLVWASWQFWSLILAVNGLTHPVDKNTSHKLPRLNRVFCLVWWIRLILFMSVAVVGSRGYYKLLKLLIISGGFIISWLN